MLTILVLLFVITLMIGWGLRRATMQSRLANYRIDDYRLHHERLGLIAIAERWMRQEKLENLEEHAVSDRPAYWATLPNDAEIVIRVTDGPIDEHWVSMARTPNVTLPRNLEMLPSDRAMAMR